MKNKRALMERFIEILSKHYFWFEIEDLENYYIGQRNQIELTKKAYGDSYSKYLEEEFSKQELKELKDLAKELKIILPETVWYD